MCEDRGIEKDSLLAVANGSEVYQRLCGVFRRADAKYNSGLFHFEKEKGRNEPPDELTPNIIIDDAQLRLILKSLYYPQCPYEFSVLPAEVLGNVYEQFLGKVIELTKAHRAEVIDKPEVKKAGGVYYTPSYIVNYIVKNTVGKLCDGKTPNQISKIKILDPACGSGSFLIGAYTFLLDYHRDWYVANNPEKHTKKIYQGRGGLWFLTIAEKKRILLDNIFGVDIDSQAVEVTKLSLLLKVLEGETAESIGQTYKMFHERALPDLGDNIKCGNSLISPDFFDNPDIDSSDEKLVRKINAFDWQKEFPEILNRKNPGFDAVIGNPPWGGDIDEITWYLQNKYPNSTSGYKDTAKVFVDKASSLARAGGLFSFIVPSAMMLQPRYIDVRRFLRNYRICILWNVGDKVFGPNVAAPCCIFVVQKQKPVSSFLVQILDTSIGLNNIKRQAIALYPKYRAIPQMTYEHTIQETFVTYYRKMRTKEILFDQILDLKDCGIKHQRIGVGMEEKGKSDLADRLYYIGEKQSSHDKPFLVGGDMNSSGWFIEPKVERYFRGNYKGILRENEIVYFSEQVFNLPQKIVWRQTSDRIRATITGMGWFANTLQAGILKDSKYDIKYILGLMNSKFLNFLYIESVKESGRVFPQVKLGKIRALPFRQIDMNLKSEKEMHDKMVKLVDQMLDLHKRLASSKVPDEKKKIQRQIYVTDKKIDQLVYELYGLTDDEIRIVEESTK